MGEVIYFETLVETKKQESDLLKLMICCDQLNIDFTVGKPTDFINDLKEYKNIKEFYKEWGN